MPSLKEVKSRIQSVTSTQQITKAMKMVAAAKLRRAQDNITEMRPYAQKLSSLLQNLYGQSEGESAGYSEARPVNNVLLIVVTSDKGLCGAFNSNVFKAARKHIEDNYASESSAGGITILPIGKKAFEYYTKRNFNVVGDYWNQFMPVSFDNSRKASEFAMKSFLDKKYDRVDLIYNEFKNVATQIMRVEQFLPVLPPEESTNGGLDRDYIFQPSKNEIVEELIPKTLKIQVYKAILDSNAAEHGARMTAMDQATDNAGELLKELKLTYNRTRQAAITKEILEIVGGAEALG
ncbi:ATP synthase F1 subunit gamma [Fulvivirga sp. M361]|uniref:ATP synthase F1 subunit gamma n=1 Tax=Fulvivirga sp. M361 TaxID=2594266 RepID=UPI00117AA714|nr:ATP synthase F1 subunit gamma [Fulvivirga sp. M361]TRX53671.1 ATP synthase F1 subunit gamma [Fulvivirga sp. M361]